MLSSPCSFLIVFLPINYIPLVNSFPTCYSQSPWPLKFFFIRNVIVWETILFPLKSFFFVKIFHFYKSWYKIHTKSIFHPAIVTFRQESKLETPALSPEIIFCYGCSYYCYEISICVGLIFFMIKLHINIFLLHGHLVAKATRKQIKPLFPKYYIVKDSYDFALTCEVCMPPYVL